MVLKSFQQGGFAPNPSCALRLHDRMPAQHSCFPAPLVANKAALASHRLQDNCYERSECGEFKSLAAALD
jgi:hypothetical protein